MKFALTTLAALALSAGAAFADPVLGTWKTQPGDSGNHAHVSVAKCGAEICGTLGDGYNSAGQKVDNPNKGKRMVWGMKPKGDGKYAGGKIWAPDRDKTYNSKMTLSGNKLKVEGCVLGICRGQTWTRVN